jgi:hypothetical protein
MIPADGALVVRDNSGESKGEDVVRAASEDGSERHPLSGRCRRIILAGTDLHTFKTVDEDTGGAFAFLRGCEEVTP